MAKKPAQYQPINPEELSVTDEPYTGRERTAEGKYDSLFRSVKKGQRIVCPKGRAGSIANAYEKWLERNKVCKNPIIRTKRECDDGKAGVWWIGEKDAKPATTVWAGLKKAA